MVRNQYLQSIQAFGLGRGSKELSDRSPTEVPVKTVFDFGALFTGFRGDRRLEELLVEIGTNAVEKVGKTISIFK